MPFSPETYCKRRRKLAELMKTGVAIIPSGIEKTRNDDILFPFRPESSFLYLTGFREPEAMLVIIAGENPKSILFCRERDTKKEIWTGKRLGPERAVEMLLVDEGYPLNELDKMIPELISAHKTLCACLDEGEFREKIFGWIKFTKETKASRNKVVYAPLIKDISPVLSEMRIRKDSEEINVMRRAARISAEAHSSVMRSAEPGLFEYEIEAMLTAHFRRNGGDQLHAYPPIVASGENACTLHYGLNNAVINDGDLVLVDAGCELDGYAADITRTFPANGKFSEEQKIIYEIVLKAQLAALEEMRPGNTVRDPHIAAASVIAEALFSLGFLEECVASVIHDARRVAALVDPSIFARKSALDKIAEPEWFINGKKYMRFFMHGTGHFLGMDVHDAGDYTIPNNGNEWRRFKPGMVMTVEPGIYIPRDSKGVPESYWGIGVRIEDDVLITPDGHEVLSSDVPKTIADIEMIMRK